VVYLTFIFQTRMARGVHCNDKSLRAFLKIVLAPLGGRPRLAQNASGLETPHCGWVAKQPPTLVPRPETDGALFFDDVVLFVVRAALPAQLCSSFRASHR